MKILNVPQKVLSQCYTWLHHRNVQVAMMNSLMNFAIRDCKFAVPINSHREHKSNSRVVNSQKLALNLNGIQLNFWELAQSPWSISIYSTLIKKKKQTNKQTVSWFDIFDS